MGLGGREGKYWHESSLARSGEGFYTLPRMEDKSYLVQRFAKLSLGLYHVIGYSVAGEETVV